MTAVYPDGYTRDENTVISSVINLAADPSIKVILLSRAAPGTAAAIEKVREVRDDILFICGSPREDPRAIASVADIVLDLDGEAIAEATVRGATEMGAEAFVLYSYPRQLESASEADLYQRFESRLAEEGIPLLTVSTPDPADEYGPGAVERFLVEDVKAQIEQLGDNTAFFGMDCVMQAPLILQILESGGIFPGQCCPSPYLGYSQALGYAVPDLYRGDADYLLDLLREELIPREEESSAAEPSSENSPRRFGAWTTDLNALILEAGVSYGMAYCNGEAEETPDHSLLRQAIKEAAGDAAISIRQYGDAEPLDRYYLLGASYNPITA